jgi:hypothetical protein
MKLSPSEERLSSDPESEMVSGEIGAFFIRLDLDVFEAGICRGLDLVASLGAIARYMMLSEKTEKARQRTRRRYRSKDLIAM